MTNNERRIAEVQKTLDEMAEKIDASLAEDGEEDNQFAVCMQILHARASASLHLIKLGIEPKPIKPIE